MLEQGIHELLAGDATVNRLTGGRIRPLIGAQMDARPFIAFNVEAGEPIAHSRGTSAYRKATLSIGMYADTALDCASLADEVRRVLDGIAANTTTVRIAPCRFDDETDIEQAVAPGKPAPVYVRTQNYRVCYRAI